MSKLLVVFGATGQQGGSVIDYVLSDFSLSSQFKIRGICRDASKDAAKELQGKGVEMVTADMDDESSLKKALEGAESVFALTVSVFDDQMKAREFRQGKAIADAAVAVGAKHIVWSAEVDAKNISQGKRPAALFDVRHEVAEYIRGLPIKGSFFGPASFMQNVTGRGGPKPQGDGTYAIMGPGSGDAKVPWIEVSADSGKFVGALLANPDKYAGKFIAAASEILTRNEVAAKLSKASGKTVVYKALPREAFHKFMPAAGADALNDMFEFIVDYRYFGPSEDEDVKFAMDMALGKLTSFDEFLANNPPQLD